MIHNKQGKLLLNLGFVTLWDNITLMSGAVSFGVAFSVAKESNLKGVSFVIALFIGMIIGIICIIIIRVNGSIAFKYIQNDMHADAEIGPLRNVLLKLTYFFAFIWIIVSGFIGYYFSLYIIKIM